MESSPASSASSPKPAVSPPEAVAGPTGWRGFFVDWLRYTALGLDVSLISAAELAQYFEQSGGKAGTDRTR